MPLALTFAVLALAAYRVTRLVTSDTILDRPREWWFLHFPPSASYQRRYRQVWNDERGQFDNVGTWFPVIMRKRKPNGGVRVAWALDSVIVRPKHKLGQLVACPWCIGFWISGGVVAAATRYTSVPMPVAWWWGISTAVGLMAKVGD